jgi:hypothetical protein
MIDLPKLTTAIGTIMNTLIIVMIIGIHYAILYKSSLTESTLDTNNENMMRKSNYQQIDWSDGIVSVYAQLLCG